MTVTSQLLELFRVDKQLRGLRSRLDQAERFLEAQQRQFTDITQRAGNISVQAKHLRASLKNDEGEVARLDAKVNQVREQMNSAATAKEYNAFLAELSNLKDAKTAVEEKVIEAMGRVEALEAEQATLSAQKSERERILAGAKAERDARESEIKQRLEELTTQRANLATMIPGDVLRTFEQLVVLRGDEAMSVVEVVDRRNYEYSCSACMMTLPMETVNSIARGQLTRCVSCGCVLFTEDLDIAAKKSPATTKISAPKSPKTAKAPKDKSAAKAGG
ncbi:MAG: hypothetical protein H7Y88_09365 [Phycisphaerales bacterium]|nr:hypothetical protein [Phycisphaerales bacterium]